MEDSKTINTERELTADPLDPGIPSVPGLPYTDKEEEAMHDTLSTINE